MGAKLQWLLLVAALLAFPPPLLSQHEVPDGVLANGGGIAQGSHTIYCTVGQPIIGTSDLGGPHRCKSGFWYLAEIESAVEVAITAFTCEYRDDAVHLWWSVSSTPTFQGFRVYRTEGKDGEYQVLNEELIPASTYEYIDDAVVPGRMYSYYIGAVDTGGEWYSQTISVPVPPKPLTLYQNYPNPFNPSTTISLFLPERAHVTLVIYDVQGKRVGTLVDETKDTGKQVVSWDGKNDLGSTVGSGVYYYRLVVGKDVLTKKLVIIR